MSAHTPGPWAAKQIHGTGGQSRITDGEIDIAIVPRKADARLIAAAPDMREVCESVKELAPSMLAIFEREGFVFDGSGGRWEKLAFTLYSNIVSQSERARAAIAKAEGRS